MVKTKKLVFYITIITMILICCFGCSKDRDKSKSEQTITKTEAFELLKEHIKQNGVYNDGLYQIKTKSSLEKVPFEVTYTSNKEEHIYIATTDNDGDLTMIYIYPNKASDCYVTLYGQKMLAQPIIDATHISDKIEDIDLKNNYTPEKGAICAKMVKHALSCYEYEQARQNYPVTLKMLGFRNYK